MRTRKEEHLLTAAIILFAGLLTGIIFLGLRQARSRQEAIARLSLAVDARTRARYDHGDQIYRQTGEQIRAVLPGIVCWGNTSPDTNRIARLTKALRSVVDETLYSGFFADLRHETQFFSRASVKTRIAGLGIFQEGIPEILSRSGARPIHVLADFTIPSDIAQAPIRLSDEEGKELIFALQSNVRFGVVTISGIEGYFYLGDGYYDASHPTLSFARKEPGEEVPVPSRTPVDTELSQLYRACLPILWLDKPEEMEETAYITALREMLAHQLSPAGQYVILACTEPDSDLDQALELAFQGHYLNVTPKMKGWKPSAYNTLARQVFDCFSDQGAFDQVKEIVTQARQLF
ncbi:MAG: hypothetical protein IJ899_10105 [Blautia sp.]|nr:hypothetical protein [Blautia sp.]